MPNERENLYQPLTFADYDIAGNAFRAYYDADQKLVMVLDFVVNDVKPNVLLVINPVGNRKWDDILMNDYAVDLETVRPKKDNKYQKLDIEYTGLSEYDNLVRAYNAGDDLSGALADLNAFRNTAARRAALERLGAADMAAERARETVEKTNETIESQQVRLKSLRGKLSEQRRSVGKEPTKQSAAKILRTESQIDATNDKLARAKKRLISAQRRLDAAAEDAEIAREILARLDDMDDVAVENNLPASPMPTQVAEFEQPSVPMASVPQFTEIAPYQEPEFEEPKAEDMADDEVKPLFDKDPEILDEDIAFKPIDFNLPSEVATPSAPVVPEYSGYSEPIAPLNFVPPVQSQPVEPVAAPVLDSLTAVDLPSEQIAPELMPEIAPAPLPQEIVSPVPEVAPVAPVVSDVSPMVGDVLPSQTSGQPMPEISPAPIDTGMRPVSPITGAVAETATPVHHKPTMLYYVMLVVLIVLSVFTLWMYQKSANDSVPELGAQTKPVVEEVVQEKQSAEPSVATSPFVETQQPVAPIVEPEPVVEPEPIVAPVDVEPEIADVESEPVPVTPAEPVPMAEEAVPVVPVEITPEPVEETVAESVVAPVEESPFLTEETVVTQPSKPIVDMVVDKPAYNVSQNEKMFVADPEYETDVVVQEEIETCADGAAPDADGCCAGEELVDMGNGTLMCCAVGTDECFPPMF